NNCHPGIVNRLQQTQHRRERIVISCLFLRRNFESAAEHRTPHLGRKTRHDFFETWFERTRVSTEKRFKNTHRWIEHGVMLLEKFDEIMHFGFIRSEFGRVLANFNEAIPVARLLHFRKKEIEHDKIEVLDFVSATINKLAR